MTSPSCKRLSTEQAGPEQSKRARVGEQVLILSTTSDVQEISGHASDHPLKSLKRYKAEQVGSVLAKRVHLHQGDPVDVSPIESTAEVEDDLEAVILAEFERVESSGSNARARSATQVFFSPQITGEKQSSAYLDEDSQTDRAGTEKKIDFRAIYEANKEGICTWYDEEYSKKLGTPERIKHSNDPWYQKLHAWQVFHTPPPKKKPRLIKNIENDDHTMQSHNRPRRTEEARLPGDHVSVPEYPFTDFADFETMRNGNYACSHVNRNLPLDCCKTGLSKAAKKQAIKKSIGVWKGQVERLIDERKLDPKHKTWTNWYTLKLREKYPPKLFEERQEKKAEKRREERLAGKEFTSPKVKKYQPVVGASTQDQPTRQEAAMQPPTQSLAYTAPESAAESSTNGDMSRSVPALQQQSVTDNLVAAQTNFLTDLARTNPRQLRQHEDLYRDAQYRESKKETPNFVLLKKWYLAYFLKDKVQPLSTEQYHILEDGDPSHAGKRPFGNTPALAIVDSLFGEYLKAGKGSARQAVPLVHSIEGEPVLRAKSSPSIGAQSSENLSQSILTAEHGQAVENQVGSTNVAPNPFEIWNSKTMDKQIDRILDTEPILPVHCAFRTTEPVPQVMEQTQSEVFRLEALPQSFSTGNKAVDDDMKKILTQAYQTGTLSLDQMPLDSAEDEQVLRQTVENSKTDWQRQCDFHAGEYKETIQQGIAPLLAPEAPMQSERANEFDFGEPPSKEQLAVLDFDDRLALYRANM